MAFCLIYLMLVRVLGLLVLKPGERGQWRRANCTLCGARIEIGQDDQAVELLHRLNEHSCPSGSCRTVTG